MVSAMCQTIFQQPDAQSTWAPAREVVDLLEPKFPQVATYLEAAPKPVWTKVWSNIPTERLNRELRQRTDVVGISRIGNRSFGLSVRSLPSSTTIGSSRNATCHYPHSNTQNISCTNLVVNMASITS